MSASAKSTRKSTRYFIRFAGFETEDEVRSYCKHNQITDYHVWTGPDGIVRGSGELPDAQLPIRQKA